MSYQVVRKEDSDSREKKEVENEATAPLANHHVAQTMTSEEWRVKVYTKLYAALTLMSLVLVAINIIQVALLTTISNLVWIVVFPAGVFLIFMAWVAAIVIFNRAAFITPDADVEAGIRNATWHLKSLIAIKVPPLIEEEKYRRAWPKRFTRAGVLLTIMLNVILTEFVYLPVFALPAFKREVWEVKLNVTQPPITPSVVVFQILGGLQNQAILPPDDEAWQSVCDQGISTDTNPFQMCIAGSSSLVTLSDGVTQMRYAVYHPKDNLTTIPVYTGMDFFYPLSYQGQTGTVLTQTAFLDPRLADDFPRAYNCAINSFMFLTTDTFQQVNLRPIVTIDEINAMERGGGCDVPEFNRYTSYDLSVIDWGPQPEINMGNWDCDINTSDGVCTALTQIVFPTPVTTIYQSRHGKDWITILTEEGGVVGFVTFLTWFFGIFEAL